MNILYLTFDYPPNPLWGMGVHVEELVRHMRSRGHRLMIGGVDRYGLLGGYDEGLIYNPCTKSVPDNIAQKMCTCVLKTDVHCFDDLGATVLRRMKEADFRPDLVHVHGWMMARTARSVKEALGVPVLSTIHFLDIQYDNMKTEHPGGAWQKSEYFLREEEMMAVSDHLLSISDFGRELLRAAYPAHLRKTRVIRHGIEPDRLEHGEIVRPPKKRPAVTFVGRVVQDEKGVEYFCAAMSHERFRGKVDVNVIGTGPLLDSLKAQYGKEINFTGYISRAEVKKRVLASDLMVIPSMEEHFGLVALEAMSLGAVPIASNSGAFREFIADGENGFLFNVDSRDGKPYIKTGKLRGAVLKALAKILHEHSGREGAFVSINCSAYTEDLLEAELFGHKKGAFTGANEARKGRLLEAHKGTLFLDEIGTMGLNMQMKLLKAIEERSFYPLGSEKPEYSEFRIISATLEDPQALIAQGKMRFDLFQRVHGYTINLKPLTRRACDITPLVQHFTSGRRRLSFTAEAKAYMGNYSWPGNVRELKKFVDLISSGSEGRIGIDEIKKHLKGRDGGQPASAREDGLYAYALANGLEAALDKVSGEIISRNLRENEGKKTRTMADLKISTRLLYSTIKRLGIEPEEEKK